MESKVGCVRTDTLTIDDYEIIGRLLNVTYQKIFYIDSETLSDIDPQLLLMLFNAMMERETVYVRDSDERIASIHYTERGTLDIWFM